MTDGYTALVERHRQEVSEYLEDCSFFAFSDEQFRYGLEELGIDPEEAKAKLSRLPGGGFILKTKVEGFKALVDKQGDELNAKIDGDPDGLHFVADMFYTELANHEYGYTQDPTEALEALGMDLEEVQADPKLYEGLKHAIEEIESEEY